MAGPIDGVETDVCLTADGELVCLHDPLLSLGTTLGGWVHERTLEELSGASIVGCDGEPAGEPPLTLDELLSGVPPELIVQVEVKTHFRTRLVIWADYAPEVLAGWAMRKGVTGVKIEHFLLSDTLVGTLRAAGITVSAGTVNDVELLEQVLSARPRCITTDRPHELRAEAIARGLLPVAYELAAAA